MLCYEVITLQEQKACYKINVTRLTLQDSSMEIGEMVNNSVRKWNRSGEEVKTCNLNRMFFFVQVVRVTAVVNVIVHMYMKFLVTVEF